MSAWFALLRRSGGVLVVGCCLAFAPLVAAQRAGGNAPGEGGAATPLQVVIEREPLVLRAPETYKAPLHLVPIKSVEVAAQLDGIVEALDVPLGESLQARAQVLRLDAQERRLQLERAKAALEAARIAQNAAGQGTEKQLADANAAVAQLDVELAQFRLDQAIVRAPFNGTVQQVHVVQGEFVRAGQPLARVVDTTKLQVEVPVDRGSVQVGTPIEIRIEQNSTSATVQAILPLTPPFEPLRDLFESIATAVVVVDNSGGRFQPGQTVYAPLIPRLPVAEIPNTAIGNSAEGIRQVQVIRDGFVRNVGVELLGAVGELRTVISGRFQGGDELVVRSSEPLLDGTQVVPRTALEAPPVATSGGGTTGAGSRQTGGSAPAPQRPPGGF